MVTFTEHFLLHINSRQPVGRSSGQSGEQLVLVSIVLGMPQRNCQYHGICRIDLEDTTTTICPHRVSAQMGYDGNRLEVSFKKEQLPVATAEKHFASGYFIVLIDFTLPEFLEPVFQASLVIRQGIYPVQETATHYLIHF